MRERANALNEKHGGVPPDEDTAKAAVLAFAKAEGYDLTADELEAYAKQAKPLADEAESRGGRGV